MSKVIKKSSKVVNSKVTKVNVVPEVTSKKRTYVLKYILFIFVFLGVLYLLRSFIVAAIVNGRPITRVGLISSLEKKYGKQGLDEMISKNIILSEAKAKSIVVSGEEVKIEVDKIRELVEKQGATLEDALSSEGQSMEDLEENLKINKMLEKLLGDSVTVTDDEAKKYFDENIESFGEDAKYDEIKSDLIASLKQQKMGSEISKWLTEKKSGAKIIYFVDFK